MDIFNEFIKELKEEDLIEDSECQSDFSAAEFVDSESLQQLYKDEPINAETNFAHEIVAESFSEPENENFVREEIVEEYVKDNDSEETARNNDRPDEDAEIIAEAAQDAFGEQDGEKIFAEEDSTNFSIVEEQVDLPAATASGYFRKRAMDEVSFLQMVENIFSGVERQQMKIVPKPYNELPVKKALHNFLQISDDVDSPEHAQSEFQLLQETESWYSALSHRDKHISVANLRLYCETTRPPLSSPALVSLARFYRNLPYSEAARNKFDLIATRLFSKDIRDDKREMLFDRDELIEHFKGLYKEWESISIYSSDEDDSEILLTAIKFEEFTTEAEEAESFDHLIEIDFFNRLRVFKKSINENFFAPLIAATAVESNIRIGNRYVELLEAERGKENAANIEEKYGFLHDQTISDATSKTLRLVELLKEKKINKKDKLERKVNDRKSESNREEQPQTKVSSEKRTKIKEPRNGMFKGLFAVNKWLLLATIVSIVISFGLYLWAEQASGGKLEISEIKTVNLDNSSLNTYLQTARISKDTFYAVTLPAWDGMTDEKKKELLNKIMTIGGDKGFSSIHLLNKQGETVGYASADKMEVYKP